MVLEVEAEEDVVCSHVWWADNLYLLAGTIDQMRMIDRKMEIPHEGAFCDLMWSDPEEIETWAVSPRGAGWVFGSHVSRHVRSWFWVHTATI